MTGVLKKVAASLGAAVVLASCGGEPPPVAPMPPEEPARRSALAFVHCIESGGACVGSHDGQAGWDALFLLGWIGAGSPLSLLAGLSTELENHARANKVQARLVRSVERYQQLIRGAECDVVGAQELLPLLDAVAPAAKKRMDHFGLATEEMLGVIQGLDEEARESLSGGYMVRMQCRSDPFQLYLATAPYGPRQVVVGFSTSLPQFLGGEAPNREVVQTRLSSRSLGLSTDSLTPEGLVDAWISLPVEVF